MSVAAGAKAALKIADLVSRTAGSDDNALKRVLKAVTAAIGGMILLVAAVISILTSPIQYLGKLGDFQKNYGYIITSSSSKTGTSNKETVSSNNAKAVYTYLTGQMGLNSAAACGVMANILCESGFNSDLQEYSTGIGYGLCQWSFGRRTILCNWCGSNGYSYKSLDGQLHYLQYELRNSYGMVLSKLQSVENTADGAYEAGYTWCRYYEVPKDYMSQSMYRGSIARNDFWPQYGGKER